MRSILNPSDCRELDERVRRLTPEHAARWGTMSAAQMVVHLSSSLRMASGELAVVPKHLPLRYPPLKQLALYWLPIPKNLPTAPELIARAPGEWSSELRDLCAQLEAVVRRGSDGVALSDRRVRTDDSEGLGSARLPTHGSSFEAVQGMTGFRATGRA